MTALVLLLAALATSAGASAPRSSPDALLQTFRNFCMNGDTDRREAAAAAGFQAVPVVPSSSESRETAAWERDGIRLFELSAQTDPRWPLPPMCGARADIGQAGDDDALSAPLLALPDYRFMEMTGAWGRSHWNLILRKGHVQVFIDRTQPADVDMMFMAAQRGRKI